MASPPPPSLPTPNRSTLHDSSISPIFQKYSRISLLRIPNPRSVFRVYVKPITNTNSNQNDADHAQRSVDKFKLVRRNLLFSALGSKMSEIPPAFGESEAYAAAESTSKKLVELTEFPITLDSVISVTVPRPKKCRTKEEKEEEEEVLAIQGIEFVADEFVKFDVHVNDDEDDLSRPDNSEFAGSFVYLPHRRKTVTTSLRLGITDLLDDLGADGDDSIKVTLVPKHVKRPVTIGKIKIEFLK
ncbi:polyphenol oxidase, chloroplastic [Rosa sericea]